MSFHFDTSNSGWLPYIPNFIFKSHQLIRNFPSGEEKKQFTDSVPCGALILKGVSEGYSQGLSPQLLSKLLLSPVIPGNEKKEIQNALDLEEFSSAHQV